MSAQAWPIAILTRNGAATLPRALDSLAAARDGNRLDIVVVANGCTDDTATVARSWQADGVRVRVVELPRGDKANAWNTYIHDHAVDSPIHFFMDADVETEPTALRRLAAELHGPVAAVGAVPANGRDRGAAIARMITQGRVAGGLYALSGEFVADLRRRGLRLPWGWIGEDFLISWIAKGGWWLATCHQPSERLVVVPGARYHFRPLSRRRLGDMRIYARRLVRYELRSRQCRALLERPAELGLPKEVAELYAHAPHHLRMRWLGPYTPMVAAAVLIMRRARRRWLRAQSGRAGT